MPGEDVQVCLAAPPSPSGPVERINASRFSAVKKAPRPCGVATLRGVPNRDGEVSRYVTAGGPRVIGGRHPACSLRAISSRRARQSGAFDLLVARAVLPGRSERFQMTNGVQILMHGAKWASGSLLVVLGSGGPCLSAWSLGKVATASSGDSESRGSDRGYVTSCRNWQAMRVVTAVHDGMGPRTEVLLYEACPDVSNQSAARFPSRAMINELAR